MYIFMYIQCIYTYMQVWLSLDLGWEFWQDRRIWFNVMVFLLLVHIFNFDSDPLDFQWPAQIWGIQSLLAEDPQLPAQGFSVWHYRGRTGACWLSLATCPRVETLDPNLWCRSNPSLTLGHLPHGLCFLWRLDQEVSSRPAPSLDLRR